MGIVTDEPARVDFVWDAESSGPSSVSGRVKGDQCQSVNVPGDLASPQHSRFHGKDSGTMRSKAMSMSFLTVESKFSLMVRPAEVCWMKRVRMPTCAREIGQWCVHAHNSGHASAHLGLLETLCDLLVDLVSDEMASLAAGRECESALPRHLVSVSGLLRLELLACCVFSPRFFNSRPRPVDDS